jgi:hypothetical protein
MAEAERVLRDFSRVALRESTDAVFTPEESTVLFRDTPTARVETRYAA